MKNVAIIGVGLIGGSLGMALRSSGKYLVTGVGRDIKKLLLARRRGALDYSTMDLRAGVSNADIVVIATPVDVIAPMAAKIGAHVRPGTVITDVGSVKKEITDDIRLLFPRRYPAVFVGAHPLAGLEKSGVTFACNDLYRSSWVVMTPGSGAPHAAIKTIRSLWHACGARTVVMTPAEHDRLVAVTSHLPHALAFALCNAAAQSHKSNRATAKLLAGSFRDMTRIADSNTRDWAAICNMNRGELASAIDMFIERLGYVKKCLGSPEKLARFFETGKSARQRLLQIKKF